MTYASHPAAEEELGQAITDDEGCRAGLGRELAIEVYETMR